MITIVDYKLGNSGSIMNMLKWIGIEARISSNPQDLAESEKLILPGIGSFDNGIRNLEDLGLVAVLNEQVLQHKKVILGICLGMQLMGKKSEEGSLPGLGYIDAETVRFRFYDNSQRLKVPHMGWNSVTKSKDSVLFGKPETEERYYFVHSYHVNCKNTEDVLTTSTYGYEFVSSFQKNNIIGVQFHPEKSHQFGMRLLRNFAEI